MHDNIPNYTKRVQPGSGPHHHVPLDFPPFSSNFSPNSNKKGSSSLCQRRADRGLFMDSSNVIPHHESMKRVDSEINNLVVE